MLKSMTFRATLAAIAYGITASAYAMADTPRNVDVPAGELTVALQKLAEQSGVEFVYSAEQLKGVRTNGVHGEYTADKAVTKLLEGTKLKVTTHESGALLISDVNASGSATPVFSTGSGSGGRAAESAAAEASSMPSEQEAPKSFWERLRLAQADSTKNTATRSQAGATNGAAGELDNMMLEEVIVTAQKRAERLQDVPISISVLSGDILDKSTAQGVTEALSSVPGVGISESYQGGGTQVTVRGVTAGSALFNGSSPIAYYLDSVPFGLVKSAVAPDTNAYDLERVEVLRGPQGTLYGASAQNGVVRVLTRDADLNAVEFKARGAGSTTSDGGNNYRADAALNVPVVPGRLAVRAVAGYEDLGGWIDSNTAREVNDAQLQNFRLKVNANPTDALTIGLSGWISRQDYGAPSASDDNEHRNATLPETIETDYNAYGLKIGYDSTAFSIVSMTSYLDYLNDSFFDIRPLGVLDTLNQTRLESKVFSQEINLRSTLEGSWRWSLGGIYRDGQDRLLQNRRQLVAPIETRDLSKSYAVFGELTRLLADGRVELTGGLRYFSDDVTNREVSRSNGAPASQLITSDSSFEKTSPRVVLTWHASRNATLYTSYAEGFRSGFAQNGSVLATFPQIPPVEADNLKNYEVGAKSGLWDGRLNFEAAVFYMDWQDVQQTMAVDVGAPGSPRYATAVLNGESASGLGAEFAFAVEPIRHFTFGLNFSWNDLKMDADLLSGGVVLFAKNDRLNLSPEYTAGGSADYDFPLGGSGFAGRFAVSANYTSLRDWRTLTGVPGVNATPRVRSGDSMLLGRASFSLDAPDRWTATIYVDNVTNEDGSPARQPFAAIADWDARVRPRTAGLQIELQF